MQDGGAVRIPIFKILLVLIAITQPIGFYILWNKIPAPGTTVAMTAEGSPRPVIEVGSVVGATKFPDEHLLRESVQAVLRQELREYISQLAAAHDRVEETAKVVAAAVPPAPSPAARQPSNPQAAQRSRAIVDRALASGVWTDQDSTALLAYKSQLSEADRVAILEKIFGAINRQQLKPVGSLPSL